MEYVKEKLTLAPSSSSLDPDHIDANKNPHEILHGLVNMAPFGYFTTTLSTLHLPSWKLPPVQLLRSSTCSWSYDFPSDTSALHLRIELSRPVFLKEVQVFWDGGNKDDYPSDMTVDVGEENHWDFRRPLLKAKHSNLVPTQGYIWIQLEDPDPTLVSRVVIRIDKPKSSSVVHLKQIRLLEQREPVTESDLIERITQSNIRIPHLLKYCRAALIDPGCTVNLMLRITAVLDHFGGRGEESDNHSYIVMRLESLSHRESDSGLLYDLFTLSNGWGFRYLAAGLKSLENPKDHILASGNGGYVRAISSALWSVAEKGQGRDLEEILTPELLQKLYKWSLKLQSDGGAKLKLEVVVDYLICSICHCRPVLFVQLLHSMDLLKVKEGTELNGCNMTDLLEQWYNEGSIWTKLMPNDLLDLDLDLSCLETLARASQSPTSAKILKESKLLECLHFAVFDFCKEWGESRANTKITLVQLVKIVKFSKEVCIIKDLRNVLGVTEDFWFPILKFFSIPPSELKSELEELEASMINLLKALCWTHPENQRKILPALRKVISKEEKLSPFCLKLLKELVYGDERAFVRVYQSESKLAFKTQPQREMEFHPSLDVKGKDCIISVKAATTAEEILEMFEDSRKLHLGLPSRPDVQIPLLVPMQTLICASNSDSDGHPIPFLDTLELSLRKERKQPDQDLSNIAPYPSCLEVFGQDRVLLSVLKKIDPELPISPDVILSLRHFLILPHYPEVLLQEKFLYKTDCLIRLVLGLTDDVEGDNIQNSPVFESLELMPFEALNWILGIHPSSTEQGQILRREMILKRSIDFVLECLKRLQETNHNYVREVDTSMDSDLDGSIWEQWEEYETLQRKIVQEGKLICLLNILVNFINSPGDTDILFQPEVIILLRKSTVISVISAHLRNDSVLDITGHVPLYRVILQLLRSMAATKQFQSFLISGDGDLTIFGLLVKMKETVTTYSQLLEASKEKDLDLDELVKDIQTTATKVEEAVKEFQESGQVKEEEKAGAVLGLSHVAPKKTHEERYVEEMQKFQFGFMGMIGEGQVFKVPFHFERLARENWRESGQKIHLRTRRLAKESATLSSSSSLPLSYGSSIFLRCDNDRLDVIKVLIIGAVGTPYANGCFELDVYFPLDYPQSPPKVNFETAKGKGIRFGPHIYTDGQICLTLLNTWDGDPVEKWDPNTSSLLPVLVAIQSVILAEDLAETGSQPGYYANIRHLTLQHAILEQIRNPPECWKEVIHRHFWLKKDDILRQCEEWDKLSKDMAAWSRTLFKQTVSNIKIAISKMAIPQGLEDLDKKKDNVISQLKKLKPIGNEGSKIPTYRASLLIHLWNFVV